MKLFLQKKCKIFERWGLRPHTPVPPAAGGFAPKPPASGGWGLRPQTPKTAPPIANFWLRACSQHIVLCTDTGNYWRWSPRGHNLKSLALASKPQVLENWPVLGSRTALFLELFKSL